MGDRLYDLIRARPFLPFVIRTAEGSAYEIPEPNYVAFRPGMEVAFIIKPDGRGVMLYLALMTALEYGPSVVAG